MKHNSPAFYVKPTSNCEGLALTTLHGLFGGEWSERYRAADGILLKTGADLAPRRVVGWSDLGGGRAVACTVYERSGEEDEPAWAIVGGNSGLRILANDADLDAYEPAPGAEHLPPGWGVPVLLVEDADDIVDPEARAALGLDSGQPAHVPPDWATGEMDFADLAAVARGWPWAVRDALARYVAHALDAAGITDKRQRLALQEALAALFGE